LKTERCTPDVASYLIKNSSFEELKNIVMDPRVRFSACRRAEQQPGVARTPHAKAVPAGIPTVTPSGTLIRPPAPPIPSTERAVKAKTAAQPAPSTQDLWAPYLANLAKSTTSKSAAPARSASLPLTVPPMPGRDAPRGPGLPRPNPLTPPKRAASATSKEPTPLPKAAPAIGTSDAGTGGGSGTAAEASPPATGAAGGSDPSGTSHAGPARSTPSPQYSDEASPIYEGSPPAWQGANVIPEGTVIEKGKKTDEQPEVPVMYDDEGNIVA
jgi:hypothetical protein